MRDKQIQRLCEIALLLLLILGTACRPTPKSPTPSGDTVALPDTATALIPTATHLLPSATAIPPSATPQKPAVAAQRSDFIVPLPTPTANDLLTPTISAALTLSPTLTPAASADLAQGLAAPVDCTYDAQFVADVTVPDDTILASGTAFTKTWQVYNSGTCNWGTDLKLVFLQGEQMSGPTRVPVSPTLSSAKRNVSVSLTAPQTHGTYTGHWQLQEPEGQPVGAPLFVRIQVPAPVNATPTPSPSTNAAPVTAGDVPRLMLLNYFAWYDAGGWDDCNISAGDRPLEPYGSDDPAAIARHVRMALDAGADALTLQWFAPGDRTDRNLGTLLAQAQGTSLRATVIFLHHIWPGAPATQAGVVEALRYLLAHHGAHPNFVTFEDRPVIFITDAYRVPLAAGQTPQQAWAAIRAQVDPTGQAWWIVEGLDPTYLAVFDGLWVYKITHAAYPNAYLKAGQWAAAVRQWEERTGQRKLWIATLSPGWDDRRAGCKVDVRVPSAAHQRAREDGAFYRATFEVALASQPDWLWVNSFNEWVEGTYIEPSVTYGDRYLRLTQAFAAQFKGQ